MPLRGRFDALVGSASLVGVAIGVAYWLMETALHAWVFHQGSFGSELLHGGANELWMRSFTVLLFVVLGLVVQWHLSRTRAFVVQVRRLAAAVEQAGDAVLITDVRGQIEYVNPAFTRLTGYALEDVAGHTPAMLKSGGCDESYYRGLWGTIAGGKVWSGPIVDRRRDGTFYPATLTIAPATSAAGQVTHYVGIQHDMSAQVELEERLRQSEKLQTLGTLASGIAHDFNNVLTVLQLQLQLASRRAARHPDLVGLLDDLARSLGSAKALVRELVSFSRRGAAAAALEPLDLGPWFERLWPSLRLTVPDPLQLRLESPENGTWVRADGNALQQVLTNLVQNARDVLVPRGRGVITVACDVVADGALADARATRLAGARCVSLRVSDDGPGVPVELQERIFEPFFTTKGEHGTGLGLAMARETVQRHGGTLLLSSEVGRGATFHVLLPLVAALGATKPEPLAEAAAGRGERVLLALRQAETRAATRGVLESLGYQVLEASDGSEAVARFTKDPSVVDLLLLDRFLLDGEGHEAALRMLALRPNLPVIYVADGTGAEAPQPDVLAKPFEPQALATRLRALLERGERPPSGRGAAGVDDR